MVIWGYPYFWKHPYPRMGLDNLVGWEKIIMSEFSSNGKLNVSTPFKRTRWCQLKYFLCSSRTLGKWSNFTTPTKSSELIPRMIVFNIYLLLDMAILGIHVSFRGCNIFQMGWLKPPTRKQLEFWLRPRQDELQDFLGLSEDPSEVFSTWVLVPFS